MTATILRITDAPMRQTITIAREALNAVLVWEPTRWVRDVPAPPDYRIPQDADDAGWGA